MPSLAVRGLAVLCGLAVVLAFGAWVFSTPALKPVLAPQPSSSWIEVARPYPAFALSIPEAAGEVSTYAIRRHSDGGRKDILRLGTPAGGTFLQVEVYRPGHELNTFPGIAADIVERAAALSPGGVTVEPRSLDTKFGEMTLARFSAGAGQECVAFSRGYDEPRLQILGWFCRSGEAVDTQMLACAIDRFSLLSAASEPKTIALFAQAERHRTFCGQRSPLLAPTPKHGMLWKAIEMRQAADSSARAAIRR